MPNIPIDDVFIVQAFAILGFAWPLVVIALGVQTVVDLCRRRHRHRH
jgi:hypothetical protein